jgi:hypothetical protein
MINWFSGTNVDLRHELTKREHKLIGPFPEFADHKPDGSRNHA